MSIKDYKKLYKDKEVYIIASGSSLYKQNLYNLRNKLTIGVNQSYLITEQYGFHPSFMCLSDRKLYGKIKHIYETLNSKILFCNRNHPMKMDYKGSNLIDYINFDNNIHGPKTVWKGVFSYDLEDILYTGFTVVIDLAIPFAIYMGCNPIYLLGCDCDNKGYAYSRKKDIGKNQQINYYVLKSYEVVKKEVEKIGVKIYNVGFGGNLEVFERKNLEILNKNNITII